MPRCGACAQRAGSATNSLTDPIVLGSADGRLRRVKVQLPLDDYGAQLTPGAILYATGEDIDDLVASGALAIV